MKPLSACLLLCLLLCLLPASAVAADYDLDALPHVPSGWKVQFVAREPDLLHPIAMCFDDHGRLFIGGGPQFRKPTKTTPKDTVQVLTLDENGKATSVKTWAEGFNCVQALAWHGKDLWVCHCPKVTICRDTQGAGVADEYVDVFTDLGPLRHGLHGFNWGPDGNLYMSQGNTRVTKRAPEAFRDLMGVVSDAPATQPLRKYTREQWLAKQQEDFLAPYNDETEGGILRCGDMGRDLEIFARGMRNPWDIAFDDTFTWMSGDNDDGPEHDRVIMPFFGANFGKRHAYSYSWFGEDNPPTVPASGMFGEADGSSVGLVFELTDCLGPKYQGGFFLGDWTQERVYWWKPRWDGALEKVDLETPISNPAGPGGKKSLFRPTDVEIGPDGALYVLGWGARYGSRFAPYGGGDDKASSNEGRCFRFWNEKEGHLVPRDRWLTAKRDKPYEQWTVAELIEDLGSQVPVWRVNAQQELVRRGKPVLSDLFNRLDEKLTTAQGTWLLWAIGRIAWEDERTSDLIAARLGTEPRSSPRSLDTSIQALRILAFRYAKHQEWAVAGFLGSDEPRLRFEAAQALWQLDAKSQVKAVEEAAAKESDQLCFYAEWHALMSLRPPEELKPLLKDDRAGVRRAALLSLLEGKHLAGEEVVKFLADPDPQSRRVAALWVKNQGSNVAQEALLPLLDNPDKDIRVTVLQALAGVKLGAAAHKHVADLHAAARGEERAAALAILAGDKDALPMLWDEMASQDPAVRFAAAKGLSRHKDQAVTFVISHVNNASDAQRDAAVAALGSFDKLKWIAAERDMAALAPVLDSSDVTARRGLLNLLGRAQNLEALQSAKPLLVRAALDGNNDVREAAVKLCQKAGVAPPEYKPAATTVATVLPLVPKADPERGRRLFAQPNVGCTNCHQVGSEGRALGPDLSNIALRQDARYIAESILEPNKVIVEGFQPTYVRTKDGDVLEGLVKDETADALKVYEVGKPPVVVKKADIASRKLRDISYMPEGFARALKPEEVADLVSWLLTQKNAGGAVKTDDKVTR